MNKRINEIPIRNRRGSSVHKVKFSQYLLWAFKISDPGRLCLEVIFLVTRTVESYDNADNSATYLDEKRYERVILEIVLHFVTQCLS
jgi:hypothetical protein